MTPRYVTLAEAAEILCDEWFHNGQVPDWPDDAIGRLGVDTIIVVGLSRDEAYAELGPMAWTRLLESMQDFPGLQNAVRLLHAT